jgi:hypothetical protein
MLTDAPQYIVPGKLTAAPRKESWQEALTGAQKRDASIAD